MSLTYKLRKVVICHGPIPCTVNGVSQALSVEELDKVPLYDFVRDSVLVRKF